MNMIQFWFILKQWITTDKFTLMFLFVLCSENDQAYEMKVKFLISRFCYIDHLPL